jgi:uncharacterized membrane protein
MSIILVLAILNAICSCIMFMNNLMFLSGLNAGVGLMLFAYVFVYLLK